MYVPQPTPDQVLSWVVNNIPHHKTRKGGSEVVINNPFDGDTGYHFNISTSKGGLCHDWRGNDWAGYNAKTGKPYKPTFYKFVQLYKNCSFKEAVRDVLGSLSGVSFAGGPQNTYIEPEAQERQRVALPEGAKPLGDTKKSEKILSSWLASRGITRRLIEKYGILYNGMDVIWPYYEFGELVYWQSRSRLNKSFLFPPESVGATKSDFIYGFDYIEPNNYMIICESIIDAINFDNQAAATGGVGKFSDHQIKKIKLLHPSTVILAADNDVAGINNITISGTQLTNLGIDVMYSYPPQVEYVVNGETKKIKDWNEYGQYVIGFNNMVESLMNRAKSFRENKVDLALYVLRQKNR